jgi:hypothetical protein
MISERAFAHSFDSFWKELLPFLNPSFVSIFNVAYEHRLTSEDAELEPLPISEGIESPDLVAEFAFRLARAAHQNGVALKQEHLPASFISEAEKEALKLILQYENKISAGSKGLSTIEQNEGLQLARRYQPFYEFFPPGSSIEFCPQFPGAGFLDSCEGDLGISSCLVEVKTTTKRPSGKDLRQLLVYLALSSKSGRRHWKEIGIFNPRRGTLHRVEIEPFVLRISGGRPSSDVFEDLISFTESNEPVFDRRF